jgi:GH25 family lysozyme M1 (1,4-beta-N-acetylmuramidase)
VKISPRIIDISHYNEVQIGGFTAAAKFGIWGLIHKATEGNGGKDAFYPVRRNPAIITPLLWGAYHFLRPGSVKAQWDVFLSYAKPDNSTLLAIDYEVGGLHLDMATEFAQAIEGRTGCGAVLYGPRALLVDTLGVPINAFWKGRRIWLAEYASSYHLPASWPAPWAWQFTGDGNGPQPHTIQGIAGWCDVNHYAGTQAQLKTEWAKGTKHLADVEPHEKDEEDLPAKIFSAEGKLSWFGGPDDRDVAFNEGLAIFSSAAQMRQHGLGDFLLPGRGGLARHLNPDKPYVACRWNYKKTSQSFLRDAICWVQNPKTEKMVAARPVDWGPASRTRRVADLSPAILEELGLGTDDTCRIWINRDGK